MALPLRFELLTFWFVPCSGLHSEQSEPGCSLIGDNPKRHAISRGEPRQIPRSAWKAATLGKTHSKRRASFVCP